jgi:hypothetical protein
LWDAGTQSLTPSWAVTEDTVAYGDSEFGIGELSIPHGKTRSILQKNSGVYDILLSPSGRWISFERWPGKKEAADRYNKCFGVVSRNGRKILYLPETFISWPYMYADWHPTREGLAVLRRNCISSSHDLYYWSLELE